MTRGRPAIGGKTITVRLRPGVAEKIDAVADNRPEFIRDAIEQRLGMVAVQAPKPVKRDVAPEPPKIDPPDRAASRREAWAADDAALCAWLRANGLKTARQAAEGIGWMPGRVDATVKRLEYAGSVWVLPGGLLEVL